MDNDIKQVSFHLDGEQRKCSIVNNADEVVTYDITEEQQADIQATLADLRDSLAAPASEVEAQ